LNVTTHRSVHLVSTASLAAGLTLAVLLAVGLAQSATAGNTGPAGCRDSAPGVIRPNGLFHDGGPLYVWPSEPNAFSQVILTLRTYACDAQAASLVYQLTADQPPQSVPLHWIGRDRTGYYDRWQTTIHTGPDGSLLTYRFDVHNGATEIWLGATGVASTADGVGSFAIAPGFHTPTWAQNAIFYQIFPDRFRNGDPHNDVRTGEYIYQGYPVLAQPWSALPENPGHARDFFGGDLAGIMQEINPYLKQTLGVTALYFNPIFQSLSNHKYDTQDYFNVDPHFGTNADLVALLNHAHSTTEYRGDYRMSVILDGVFNHTGDSIRWFNKENLYPPEGAYNTQQSPWYSFYTFTHWPDQYDDFLGCCPTLPRLNYATPGVRDVIYRTPHSVMQTYLRAPYQIDGWRFDDAKDVGSKGGVDDNRGIWQEVRRSVRPVAPQGLLLGEIFDSAQPWLDGTQWDGAMNYYGFGTPVSEWVTGWDLQGHLSELPTSALNSTLATSLAALPRPAQLVMLNSLSTHDVSRFLYRAGGNVGELDLAQILQMAFVGMPCVYYGDEIGMTGATDPDDRRPFIWDTMRWNRTVMRTTIRLIALRRRTPVLRTGSFVGLLTDAHAGYAFGRWQAGQRAVVVLNDDRFTHTYQIPVAPVEALPGSRWRDALRGGTVTTAAGDSVIVTLPAYSGTILVQTTR
jgi:alpha-glucosidase